MADQQPPAEPIGTGGPGAGTTPGAVIHPHYGRRQLKIFPVTAGEMRTLNHDETFIALFASAVTFFAGIAASIWVGVELLAQPVPAVAVVLRDVVIKVLLVIVLICLVLIGISLRSRHSTMDDIEKESFEVEIKART